MKYYLRVLSSFYLFGGGLHLLDLFDLRLIFSEMTLSWKIWIVYLAVFDLVAALGLWKARAWGIRLFIFIAVTQLIAYSGLFVEVFGEQLPLVVFHIVTLFLYAFFKRKSKQSQALVC